MKRILSYLLPAVLFCSCSSGEKEASGLTSAQEKKIDSLMRVMTIDEKIGQLNLLTSGQIITGEASNSNVTERIRKGEVGGILNLKGAEKVREVQKLAVEEGRLGIPMLFGLDVVHGYETIFPIPLGLSCSWDMEAIEKSARIAAIEASADGICWTFSPMVDISRDPRWGRVSEGNGEDPYLGAEIARAMIRGYQGDNLERNDEIMACVKHFALYGASEAGRDYNTVDMSRHRMYNEYFLPYQAGIEAGAGSVMASFNEIDGIPATGNKWLLTDVLREEWGFGGFVVTDFTGIYEMIAHGMGNMQDVSDMALKAGVDMDMVSEAFLSTAKRSLEEGRISRKDIDKACRRILEAKAKLGLFENPYKYCDAERARTQIFCNEHRAVARRIAAESMVLLKNESVLPLEKEGTVAVIGPLADSRTNMPGTWSVAAVFENATSLVEGMKAAVGDKVKILTAKGCNLMSDAQYENRVTRGHSLNRDKRSDKELLNEALTIARKSDVIVAALGEASEMSGESSCRTELEMTDTQRVLLEELLKTGKPVVLVLFTGRPLVLNWEQENVPAILNAWFSGSEAGYAISDVLFGDVNPSGKLTMTFPKSVGQIPLNYNHKNTGRPVGEGKWFTKYKSNYLDVDNEPLYPFGYGLSYTSFEYSPVSLSVSETTAAEGLTASITVTNTGKVAGKEVVQLYIRDLAGSVTRPVKELKGFEKIYLEPGESKTVSFNITEETLSFYRHDMTFGTEPGDFHVFIGGCSTTKNMASFTLTK